MIISIDLDASGARCSLLQELTLLAPEGDKIVSKAGRSMVELDMSKSGLSTESVDGAGGQPDAFQPSVAVVIVNEASPRRQNECFRLREKKRGNLNNTTRLLGRKMFSLLSKNNQHCHGDSGYEKVR